MSPSSVVTLGGTLLNGVFIKGVFFTHRHTMLIYNTRIEKYQYRSHALARMDHSAGPEDSSCSSLDLSPASLFLPPSFNKTLIIFPQLCFSLFCFHPPPSPPSSPSPPCISVWLCQGRDMRWHQNPEAVEAWGFFSTVTIELLP